MEISGPAPRLLIVTGKGGVGKSTVAASLAVAGAREGKRTALVEVEGRQTFSRIFGTSPWDFTEREFRPRLHGLSVDPEASLVQYLELFYGARRLGRLVVGSTAVDFATSAAPGLKDVLLIGKVKEMERRRAGGRAATQAERGPFAYDLIVLDAPPTGRILSFLRAPEATIELVNLGPIRQQAQAVVEMLSAPTRTHVQLVTMLEELPVTETVTSARELRALGVTVGPVIVNRVLEPYLDSAAAAGLRDGLRADDVALATRTAGLEIDAATATQLAELGLEHLGRLALQARLRAQLIAELDTTLLDLPILHTADFGEDEVGQLADRLSQVAGPAAAV